MSSDVLYTVKGPKTLFEMTWEEVSEALEKTDIVILPVGSTEQHGPHLPLGSDSFQGTDIAKMVVAKLGGEGITVIAAPTIPFGISHAHMKFPGSITVSSSTLSKLIIEICQSLYHHGFRKFVLLLSHGGNLPTLNLVARDLVLELPEAYVIVPDWLPVMYAQYSEILISDRHMDEHHSGEAETARMLASTPNLVKLDRAEAYYPEAKVDPYAKRPYPGSVAKARGGWGMKETTPSGLQGDPKLATRETGDKLYEFVVDWLCRVIKAEFIEG
ncbi:MAG: creatininase family protein [Candidatus Bathyarchaeota archaeon]|jgi:creatinine amidohydrolase|nr:creatininase family protein [Candidatus Bathyarchaeota archaeon]MCW3991325.1 creatininase family protein [Candidatus Bathyarchaeota archaeon]